jgi:enolase
MTSEESKYLISKIQAEEIKDSRGNPTIKVTISVGISSGSFSVPSGASTGVHEAHELRDADGKGVKNAIDKINNTIAPALIGQDVLNQKEIDRIMIELDGTANKDNLGGNSMIGVSIACAKVAAKATGVEVYEHLRILAEIKPSRKVPHLFMNMLEGGKHARNGVAFQEYLIVPETDNVEEAVNIGLQTIDALKIIETDADTGYEGGVAPKVNDIKTPLQYLRKVIGKNKVHIALDCAASSFFENNLYKVDDKNISKEELLDIYDSLIQEFNLFSIEDAFDEEDFESFAELKKQNPNLLIVGDDLTVSNIVLLKKALQEESLNAMIIKPNQIGTLSETLETMRLARENNIELIVSHRGEETDDDFIADLAFAFGCFGLKAGAPTKIERMVKYERLIKISNY